MPYLALIDRLNKFLRQNSAVLIMSGYSFSDDHLNDTILNALKANPTAMVIALLYGTLTYKVDKNGEKEEETIVRYEEALKRSENRPNLSIWAYDEAVIGGYRAIWKASKEDYDPDENIGNAVKTTTEIARDAKGNDTEEKIKTYEFQLGDFAILGDFLQELVGKDQFQLVEENGK